MKKVLFFCIFQTWAATVLVAQSLGLSISSNQQMIEDAVKDGLFVIHQYYQLQDTTAATPSYYGWNNNPHFGDTYSLGVKTTNGYYVGDRVIRPWIYDSKFEEYRNSNQFAPVFLKAEYRQFDSTSCSPLALKDVTPEIISENRVFFIDDAIFDNKGFSADYADGTTKGWLVWAVTDKPLPEADRQPLSLLVYRSELVLENRKELYEVRTPSTQKTVLGGIYILPEVTEIGKITFRLLGILHYENDRWNVVKIKTVANMLSTPGSNSLLTPGSNSLLTPVVNDSEAGSDDANNSSPDTKQKNTD
ncbi:MAG: hypothetical protein LBR10_15930 [Prevotellaceae bacterium]|jgi:hypothetical protein|nr:hypothetical protein [Prevotellaceae bacterium]